MTQRTRLWCALGAVYLIWGSTYLAIRLVVESAPPLVSGGLRFVVAGLIVAGGIAATRGPGALRVTWAQLLSCVLIGGLLLLGGNGLIIIAEQRANSSLAALTVASVPLIVIVIRSLAGDRPSRATTVSVAIGFAGIALLVGGSSRTGVGVAAVALLVLAPVSWAVGSWLSPRLPLPADALVSTAWQSIAGGALMLATGSLRGEWRGFSFSDVTARSWAAWAYLVVAGSLIAFTAYIWLLQHAPLSTVATYAYVNPAVAVVLGAIVLSERLTPVMALGAMAVVVSVAVVVTNESLTRRVVRVMRPRAPDEDACATDTTGAQHCVTCAASCALAGAAPVSRSD